MPPVFSRVPLAVKPWSSVCWWTLCPCAADPLRTSGAWRGLKRSTRARSGARASRCAIGSADPCRRSVRSRAVRSPCHHIRTGHTPADTW